MGLQRIIKALRATIPHATLSDAVQGFRMSAPEGELCLGEHAIGVLLEGCPLWPTALRFGLGMGLICQFG